MQVSHSFLAGLADIVMDNSSSVALPNPNTPLAFLDPESAYQTSVSIYVLAGSLGVSMPFIFADLIIFESPLADILVIVHRCCSGMSWTISGATSTCYSGTG